MNRDDIDRMAREAGYLAWNIDARAERFAALVAIHEREACARVCLEYCDTATDLAAAAIRARGEDSLSWNRDHGVAQLEGERDA